MRTLQLSPRVLFSRYALALARVRFVRAGLKNKSVCGQTKFYREMVISCNWEVYRI